MELNVVVNNEGKEIRVNVIGMEKLDVMKLLYDIIGLNPAVEHTPLTEALGIMKDEEKVIVKYPVTENVVEPQEKIILKTASKLREEGMLTGPSIRERYPDVAEMIEEALLVDGNHDIRFSSTDGEPMFKTQYNCPNGHSGKRYMFDRSEYCKCHTCDTKLRMEFASKKEPRDFYGNFFVARSVLPEY